MPSDHYQMLDEKSVWLISVHVQCKWTHLHFLGGCDSNQFVYQSMQIYIGDEHGYLST